MKHRQLRVHKIYCFLEVSVNKYFIISERDSLISSNSRDTLFTNETREKENFDDWYRVI